MGEGPDDGPRILIYLLRRDLRLHDNPIFATEIADAFTSGSTSSAPRYTHLLPLYVFPAQHVEVSGFLRSPSPGQDDVKNPYPPARSRLGGFWRCGPHRAKFLAESVWDLKKSLRDLGSDLVIRAGLPQDVVRDALEWFTSKSKDSPSPGKQPRIAGVWMTKDEPVEECTEERALKELLGAHGAEFRTFRDEKYFVDDRDLPFDDIKDLPNIYTTFRQKLEPLRERPQKPVASPSKLPPLPASHDIPPQSQPFEIPDSEAELLKRVMAPFEADPSLGLPDPPRYPPATESAHPFLGGETRGQERVWHLLSSGVMTSYKDTRNGLLGADFSTKLAAYLTHGCISARWVHAEMLEFEGKPPQKETSKDDSSKTTSREDGAPLTPNPVVSSTNFSPRPSVKTNHPREAHYKSKYPSAKGYNEGENAGTAGVRFELLWRDYMRLCARKFGSKLFRQSGFVEADDKKWKAIDHATRDLGDDPATNKAALDRFRQGRTGIGLIDAAQRELFLTGYSSNRARQNVASFLAKHLEIDWRLGAEWYECLLVDYDCPSNWGNWQYVAGVGNDPRQGRTFNPVKQALDYDKHGAYVKAWVPELRGLDTTAKAKRGGTSGSGGGGGGGQHQYGARSGGQGSDEQDPEALMGVFQAWRMSEADKERLGLKGVDWVEQPLVRIPFEVRRGGGNNGRNRGRGRDGGGGGGAGGRGGYGGRGGRGGYRERGGGGERSNNINPDSAFRH